MIQVNRRIFYSPFHFINFSTLRKICEDQSVFKNAVFNQDLFTLKTNFKTWKTQTWFEPYTVLMSLTTENIDQNSVNVANYCQNNSSNVENLAFSLQWISMMSHKLRVNIIHPHTYSSLVNRYYSCFEFQQNNLLKKQIHNINSRIKLDWLLPKQWIYMNEEQIGKTVKQNQIFLLDEMQKSRKITIQECLTIINPHVFNITDLPMFSEHLYTGLFPQISKINSLDQFQKILAYLSHFSIIPIFLPLQLLNILKTNFSQAETVTVDEMLQISNCLYLISFKFSAAFQKSGCKSEYQLFINELMSKQITWGKNKDKIDIIIKNNQKAHTMILNQTQLEVKNKSKLIQTLKNTITTLEIKSNTALDDYFKNLANKFSDWNNEALLRKTISLKLRIKLLRLVYSCSIIGAIHPSVLYRFLQFPRNYQLFQKNPLIPDLLKSTKLLFQQISLQMMPKDTIPLQSYVIDRMRLINQNITGYLNKEIKQSIQNIYKNPQCLSQIIKVLDFEPNFQLVMIRPNSNEQEIVECLSLDFNFSAKQTNLIKLLKNDPNFLISLMRFNSNRYFSDIFIRELNINKLKKQVWDYPHFYSLKLLNFKNQKLNIFIQNEIDKNAAIPKIKNKEEQYLIQQKGSLISAIMSARKFCQK